MDERTRRLARLIVDFGANVQPGQLVDVNADIGEEELARAVAEASYRRGAKFVDVTYYDPYVKRSRLDHVPEESLEYIPSWHGERARRLAEAHAATISLAAPTAPHLFEDVDPDRLGRDIYPRVKEWNEIVDERTVNWCVAPCPTQEWASLIHPGLDPDGALDKLWQEVEYVCRLTEQDPAEAWRRRNVRLREVASTLTAFRFDALHFEGGGTNLTVGLLPTSQWLGGGDETIDGIEHMPNLPTEEVFSAPDPERTEGTVRATMPLVAYGAIIEGLRLRFEGGRAVEIDAERGGETMRRFASLDEQACRLGEVALVDREGRVGRTGTVFYNTLLDENAASHIALGDAYDVTVEPGDRARLNVSELHLDFMIGGPGVDVTGILANGERVPVLREGAWRL